MDGTFGLWAAANPSHAHLTAGMGRTDSWATDAHKWLNVPYDSGIEVWAALKSLGRFRCCRSGKTLLQTR